MRIEKRYHRPDSATFRSLYRQMGYRPQWTYFAWTPHRIGVGKTARAAQHDARKQRRI